MYHLNDEMFKKTFLLYICGVLFLNYPKRF